MSEPSLSFGPVVWQKPDGELEARCYAGGVMCTFLTLGQTCTHVRPPRAVGNVPATPEWCEMRADALRDAEGEPRQRREMMDDAPMARERAIAMLREAQESGDYEDAHIMSDGVLADLLTALGYADVVAEWEKVGKWYS